MKAAECKHAELVSDGATLTTNHEYQRTLQHFVELTLWKFKLKCCLQDPVKIMLNSMCKECFQICLYHVKVNTKTDEHCDKFMDTM